MTPDHVAVRRVRPVTVLSSLLIFSAHVHPQRFPEPRDLNKGPWGLNKPPPDIFQPQPQPQPPTALELPNMSPKNVKEQDDVFSIHDPASRECTTGWYGSRCQYRCHCKHKGPCLKETGLCISGSCENGWFDLGCQYEDRTPYSTAPAWLTDGNKATCNPNTAEDMLLFMFEAKEIITRYKLLGTPGSATALASLNLYINEERERIENARITYWGNVVEIIVEEPKQVKEMMIVGPGVGKLCTLHTSTGRNVALRQKVTMSTTLRVDDPRAGSEEKELSDAYLAIDGDRNQEYPKTGCAQTDFLDDAPTWTIEFDHPMIIHRMDIYKIDRFSSCPEYFVLSRATGRCYSTFQDNKSFEAARESCWSYGAELAVLPSMDMLNTVANFPNFKRGCWLGLTDHEFLHHYAWLDGSTLDYNNWKPNHPSHLSNKPTCVHTDTDSNLTFVDDSCDREMAYCCVIDPKAQFSRFTVHGYDSNSNEVYTYEMIDSDWRSHYSLLLSGRGILLQSIRLAAPTDTTSFLHICEFEAHGDIVCVMGKFGPDCNYTCHCAIGTCTSFGLCQAGCAPGYQQPYCTKCPAGFYHPPACLDMCSPTCRGACHGETGDCNDACQDGYFGQRCNIDCNPNCKGGCHRVKGTCIVACKSGLWGTDCSKRCPSECRNVCQPQSGMCPTRVNLREMLISIVAVVVCLVVCVLCACVGWKKRHKRDVLFDLDKGDSDSQSEDYMEDEEGQSTFV